MYNLYTTSTVSLRSRASPSYTFNDHPTYSRPSYNAKQPYYNSSSCCCYCNCCSSIPVNCVTSCGLVPINPSLTFGFRQSTLIQWPPSRRRLILASVDRCGFDDPGRTRIPYGRLCRIRDAGADRIKEESKNLKVKGIGLWGYRTRVFQERSVYRRIGSACEDAEAMISLLTEEVGQELLYRNGKAKENAVKGKSNHRKGDELQCSEAQNRKERYRTRRGEEDLGKGEYSRLRKQVSGDSSYYSCSDSDDYESDSEVVVAANQYIGNSRKDDVKVRKYTKNLTDDSCRETASRRTSILNQSNRSEAQVSAEETSRKKKQYSFNGEVSISDMNSSEALRSEYSRNDNRVSGTSDSRYKYGHLTGSSDHVHKKPTGSSEKGMGRKENVISGCEFCATCGQASLGNQTRRNSEQRPKISQIKENNISLVSNFDTQAESRHKRMEERTNLLQMSAHEVNQLHRQEHHIASGHINSQNYTERADAAQCYEENTNSFRRRDKHSETQNTDTMLTSTANQQSNSRINSQEETSTSLQTSLEDLNEKIHQENVVATSRTDLIGKSQIRSNRADAGVIYVQDTTRTQEEEEARMKFSEENMAVKINISPQHAKGGQYHSVTETGSQNQYTNASQDVSGGSQVHIHKTTTSNAQSASYKKSHHKQSYLTERVKLAEQRIETREQVEERVKQTDIRYELQRPLRVASSHEKETSNSYGISTSQVRIKETGDGDYEKNLTRLAPPTQSIERDPMYAESASRFIRGDSSQSSEGDTGIYIYPQATGVSPSGQEEQLISHVDLLGSAERQNRSSLQVITDFVDQARHEASNSATRMEKKSTEVRVDEESTQSVGENLQFRKQYSRRSSGSGTTKGPAEEMWGPQEPHPQEETSQTAAPPVDAVAGRSGRTLWNVLADIARFRWAPRAESNKSPVKSGGKSSSSDSLNSEAWFSGHDPDEMKGSDMNRSNSSRVPESSSTDRPLLIRTPTQSSTERFTSLNTGDDAGPTVQNVPSSSSGGISGETNLELNAEEEASQATTSVDWSQPAAGLLRRSHRRSYATFEMQEGGNEAVGNVRMDQKKDDHNSSITEVSDSGEIAVELERRKLLRNKQVVRERFEEWEEAYKMESEQRKMDEIFMREALEEAKKAADMWEVPVGAVLVHDGKIIVRGYNLVEDLRDSTAHAEMICIREASNILKAWRLSDTTLYVTLEPCAMCAGAILQARIGTLVYGAPNKLLGADGSWIRLFPSSSDGDGGSESSTNKPEGPVHPFHPKMTIRRGILENECSDAMQQFFRLRRKKDKKTEQQQEHDVQQSSSKKLIHPSKLLNKMHHVFHFLFCFTSRSNDKRGGVEEGLHRVVAVIMIRRRGGEGDKGGPALPSIDVGWGAATVQRRRVKERPALSQLQHCRRACGVEPSAVPRATRDARFTPVRRPLAYDFRRGSCSNNNDNYNNKVSEIVPLIGVALFPEERQKMEPCTSMVNSERAAIETKSIAKQMNTNQASAPFPAPAIDLII
ncbi:hypothetical protein V2J09_004103 [Rumex salicifolius]